MDGERKIFFRDVVKSWFFCAREKRPGIAACVSVYLAGSFFYLYRGLALYRNMGLHICVADCYVMASMVGKRIMVGIPVFLAVTLLNQQNSRDMQYVLHMKKRSCIWLRQCADNGFGAILMASLETVTVGVFGRMMTPSLLVWNEQGSVFWDATGHTITEIHFWQIVISFGAVTWVVYLFTGMLVSFVEWLTDSYPAGICACLILAFAENFSTVSVLYQRATVFYSQWLTGGLWGNWLWACLMTILLVLLGGRCAERKEFYG